MARFRPLRGHGYRRASLPAAAALLIAALCTGTAPPEAAAVPVRQDTFDAAPVEKLDTAIAKAMKETGISGLNIGVWIPGRASFWTSPSPTRRPSRLARDGGTATPISSSSAC
ncbi:hypothetical protein [Streptomyces goshikiensis]|uniref:hypothetical protein n=1 Tax=Streptomyces goshikiensis TaxID=1942 RepID=UPI003697C6B0